MINPRLEEARLLMIYISNLSKLSKTVIRKSAKISLSDYPDIRVIQKKLRRSIKLWVYFNKPIDYIKLKALASSVYKKAKVEAEKSAPKS
jgi:hypothetical protein